MGSIIFNESIYEYVEKQMKMEDFRMNKISGILAGILAIIIIVIFSAITTVPTGYVGIKTRIWTSTR